MTGRVLFWTVYIGGFVVGLLWIISGWHVNARRAQLAIVAWLAAVAALVLR